LAARCDTHNPADHHDSTWGTNTPNWTSLGCYDCPAPVDSKHADRVDHPVGYHCLRPTKRERKPPKLRASTSEQPERPIHPNLHASLVQAIKNTNFVTLVMRDQSEESGEPHVYGQRDGHPMVLLYNGETDPTWQLIEVREVGRVKIWLDEHFSKREPPPEYDPDRETH